jgi:5-methyltetrahydrofolate--homocysteine methyltransferase
MLSVKELFNSGRTIVYDGPKGTSLMSKNPEHNLSDIMLNISNRNLVLKTLKRFVDAGAEIIQTNTLNANYHSLEHFGNEDVVREKVIRINKEGVKIAKDAAGKDAYVAGCVGPSGLGLALSVENISRKNSNTKEDIRHALKDQIQTLITEGVNLIHLETFSALGEAQIGIELVREINPNIPIIVTMSFDTPARGINSLVTNCGHGAHNLAFLAANLHVDAYGANCGAGHEGAVELLKELKPENLDTNSLLVVKLNRGMPKLTKQGVIYDTNPIQMRDHTLRMMEAGARIIGVCCGGTPRDIEIIANTIAKGN